MKVHKSKFKSSRLFVLALMASVLVHTARGQGLPPLPEGITSFGAAVAGDALYVYGGHIGQAHAHSTENHSQGFRRLQLGSRRAAWESLPMETPLQGLAMVAHGEMVYRIGGLSMRNAPDEAEDLHSVAEFARFDPASGSWESLPPLPEPRSSHDAAVLDGKLYVVGGWTLAGDSEEARWADKGFVMDLNSEPLKWESIPQPFRRRAIAAASAGSKLYAIGGLTDSGTSDEVSIYDPATGRWSDGPALPTGTRMKAFAASAFGVGETLWASAIDGRAYALRDGAASWTDTGFDLESPRFFHRLVPQGDRLLFIAGANKKTGHLDSVESVEIATLLAAPLAAVKTVSGAESDGQSGSKIWQGFRGDGQGHTPARDLPVSWSDDENIAWRVALPGYGQSSPVVWNDRVFVTSVEGEMHETLHVTCLALANGAVLWTRDFPASQQVKDSDYVSKAAPTPVVDGAGVYAFYESGDLIALRHDGIPLWQRSLTKDYGPYKGNHGLGASIAQTGGSIIVLADHEGPSYLLALDKATGRNLWKSDREPRVSWSSPVIVKRAGREEVFISSNGVAEAFNAADGKPLWRVGDLTGNTVASPVSAGGHIVIGSSEDGSCIAIDAAGGEVAWKARGALSSFASPLVHAGDVYYISKAGVATCVDLATGEKRWALRLPSSCWASPIAAGDRIYFFCTDGQTLVLRGGQPEPTKIAESNLDLDGGRIYGAAAVDGAFVIRAGRELIRVGWE